MTDDKDIARRNAEMFVQYQRVMDGEPIGPGPLVIGVDEEFAAWLVARGIGESLRKYAARTPVPHPTHAKPMPARALGKT
jgi:hypothetical protein